MVVKIIPNDKANPPGKLADAELHFTDGVLDGLCASCVLRARANAVDPKTPAE